MPVGTTLRNFRADDELWQSAKAVAEARGESLSDVLRLALEQYAKGAALTGRPPSKRAG